jgi:hypothetical protein
MKTNDKELTHSYTSNPSQLVIYDKYQKVKNWTSVCIMTSLSLKAIAYMVYKYVIKYEAEKLLEDIQRVNKRFASNTYSRIVNEFNIFMLNSIEINSIEDSHNCFVFGYAKYLSFPDSQNMLSELVSTSSFIGKDFDMDFFLAIYLTAIKKTIGLGASLETLKRTIIPYQDLDYNRHEKTNLRGAHSQLSELRDAYDKKMNYNSTMTYVSETNDDSLVKFTNKLKTMITNPDLLMCNHISSQNTMNLRNFQENFINVNQMGVKDLYNNILDTTDGLISMRLQNSISKSIYAMIIFVIAIVIGYIIRKVRK